LDKLSPNPSIFYRVLSTPLNTKVLGGWEINYLLMGEHYKSSARQGKVKEKGVIPRFISEYPSPLVNKSTA